MWLMSDIVLFPAKQRQDCDIVRYSYFNSTKQDDVATNAKSVGKYIIKPSKFETRIKKIGLVCKELYIIEKYENRLFRRGFRLVALDYCPVLYNYVSLPFFLQIEVVLSG
jgi:hypothetical protein